MAELWGASRSSTFLTVTISALAKLPFFKEILKDWLKQNEIRLQDSPAIELCSFLIDCDEDFAVTALGFQQAANILSTYFPEFVRCHAATQVGRCQQLFLLEVILLLKSATNISRSRGIHSPTPMHQLCLFDLQMAERHARAFGFNKGSADWRNFQKNNRSFIDEYFMVVETTVSRCYWCAEKIAVSKIEIAVDIYLPERQKDEQISMDLQTIIDHNFNQVRQVQVIELSRRCALGCWGSYEMMRLITRFPTYMVLRIQRADQHRQQKDRVILNEVVTIRNQSAVRPLAYYYVVSVFTRDSPQAASQRRNRVYSYHLYSNRWHMTEGNVLNILEFGAVNVPDVQQSLTTIILKRSSNTSLKRPAE
ncbi:hypothetical protein HPB51_004872 [Rhipicephalus microplus]|uniref:Uncharacterized protein n=1 Tax=Rhipicephalus microplus TaxID=6941 RepID=A0A9J6E6Z3_RHIMP|nr:hypothetical protein HPB51_004872 [Rhipicephalus microplus]